MKKLLIVIFALFIVGVSTISSFAIRRPTLMARPSKTLCEEKGYIINEPNSSGKSSTPNYKEALEDYEISRRLIEINAHFADMGVMLKDFHRCFDIEDDEEFNSQPCTADIFIEYYQKKEPDGLVYSLEAIDSESGKRLAYITGKLEKGMKQDLSEINFEDFIDQIFNNLSNN